MDPESMAIRRSLTTLRSAVESVKDRLETFIEVIDDKQV